MAKRAYCKNTVKGKQRGKKYPEALRSRVSYAGGTNEDCVLVPPSGGAPRRGDYATE